MLQPLPNVPFGQASKEREGRRGEGGREGRREGGRRDERREGGREGGRERGREKGREGGGMEGRREGGREGGRERRLGTCYIKYSLMFDICNTVTSSQVL